MKCSCSVGFQRGIPLISWTARLAACMQCGEVTAESGDGQIISLSEQDRSWIGQWPRRAETGDREYVLLSASLRYRTEPELRRKEEDERKAQLNLSYLDRFLHAGYPEAPPSPGLPPSLELNSEVPDVLQVDPKTSFERLLDHAIGVPWLASSLARERIVRFPQHNQILTEMSKGPDSRRWGNALRFFALQGIQPPQSVFSTVLERLNASDLKAVELSQLLTVIPKMGPGARKARSILLEIKKRRGKDDLELAESIDIVMESID